MQPVRRPFGGSGPLFDYLGCPRCATPLAIIGETHHFALDRHTRVIGAFASIVSKRLQMFQPGATIPAYLLLKDATSPAEYAHLVWPPHDAAVISAEAWAEVGPALLALHRCLPLPRLH